jgi:hypothetical protein
VVERPRKRKRVSIDSQYPEYISGTANSLGPERFVVVQSLALWVQQYSIVPTAQPSQLDGPQHSPETRSQHSHVLIHNMRNSTPQNQSGTATDSQVTKEQVLGL